MQFSATLYNKLSFNFIRDIAPVAGVLRAPNVLVANPSFPVQTIPELIAYTKAQPGKINFGSAGTGTSQHLSGELLKFMTGTEMVHVPYRGAAPAIADVLAGQIPLMFASLPGLVDYMQTGKLRAIAVTSTSRSETLPEVPAFAEIVAGYESSAWFGLEAPKATSTDIIDKLSSEIVAALANSQMKARLADVGAIPMPMNPTQFGSFIADETEKWGKVIRAANIKPE